MINFDNRLRSRFPSEIWEIVLKKCLLNEVKNFQLICKQICLVARKVFCEERVKWYGVLPDVKKLSINSFVKATELAPLYHSETIYTSIARIIGIERFNHLSVLKIPLKLIDRVQAEQMNAPLMIGTVGEKNPIQFMAIRYQILPKVYTPALRPVWERIYVMTFYTAYPGDSFQMKPGVHCPFPNILSSQWGIVARYQLLPELLREGSVEIKTVQEARDHTIYPEPHTIRLV